MVNGAREIVNKHPNQSILAVSHAGALMTFLHAVEPERAFQSCPGNCAILVFDYDGSNFHFVKLIDPFNGSRVRGILVAFMIKDSKEPYLSV